MTVSFYVDGDLDGHGEFVEGTVSLGCTVVSALPIEAVRWRYPAVAPTGPVKARAYTTGGSLVASREAFDTTNLDAWNLATFGTGVIGVDFVADPLPPGTYRIVIVTPNRYPAKAGFFSDPETIARNGLTVGPSYFAGGDAFANTKSGNGSTYYIDVTATEGDDGPEEHDGTGEIEFEFVVAAAGHVQYSGTTDVDVEFEVAGAGHRQHSGSIGLGISFTVAAVGHKVASGTGAIALGLKVAAARARLRPGRGAAGARPSSTTVAFSHPTSTTTAEGE